MCYIGNPYGISYDAEYSYVEMIKNFSPKEIKIMLNLKNSNSNVSNRIKSHSKCRNRYFDSVRLIDPFSVESSDRKQYDDLINKKL